MKRINNLPIPFDFERVTCPKCEKFCAMLIKSGPKAGMVECMSSDHIKPCKYFGDGTVDRRKGRNITKKKVSKVWNGVKKKIIREMEYLEENGLKDDFLEGRYK